MDKLALNTNEAASYLGLAAQTLKNWRDRHQGPPFMKAGSRVVYVKRDLDRWLAAHAHNKRSLI